MLDDKDRKILLQLAGDGRKSVVEISNELDMPRATVQERIRKMTEKGVIKRFTVIPDYGKIGKEVTAFILVSFSGDSNLSQRSLANEIAKIPEVYEISLISGEWDIILKVRAGSVSELGTIVIDKLRMMRGIQKTQTCVSFQTIKENL